MASVPCTCGRPVQKRPPVPGTAVPVTSVVHTRSRLCEQWEGVGGHGQGQGLEEHLGQQA